MIPARYALLFPVAVTLTGAVQQTSAPGPLADIPGIEMIYYDVTGTSADAIRTDMNGKRPVDANDGKRVDALSKWWMGWRIRRNASGQCDLGSVELTYHGSVTLPRLTDAEKLPKSVRERWQRYYTALIAHEAGHVGYAYAHRDEVTAAIKGATCETANAAGQEALKKIAQHDRDYDAETRHGITQGAVFP